MVGQVVYLASCGVGENGLADVTLGFWRHGRFVDHGSWVRGSAYRYS